jgi:hypothetical protein
MMAPALHDLSQSRRNMVSNPSTTPHDQKIDRLSKAQEPTGRQDFVAPPPTTEKSDPTPVDVRRGERLWIGFMAVGLIFVAVIVYFLVTQ